MRCTDLDCPDCPFRDLPKLCDLAQIHQKNTFDVLIQRLKREIEEYDKSRES